MADAAGDTITPGIRAFYEDWRSRMQAEGIGGTLPPYEDLDAPARRAWAHAYAATVELSACMAEACSATLGDRP